MKEKGHCSLWPYVDFNFIIFMPKIYKITVIFFVLHFIYVAAMKCLKQDHKGHVIVSLMLLISLLLTFFESCMKQRIPKIIRTSNIMIHSYSLHIIYKNLYDQSYKKSLDIYNVQLCIYSSNSSNSRTIFVASLITRSYLG